MTTLGHRHGAENQQATWLSVCIVTYNPELPTLLATLENLRKEIRTVGQHKVGVTIVDNSPLDQVSGWLKSTMPDLPAKVVAGHGNIGFGRANNLVLAETGALHLVLNPDVVMESGALGRAIAFMEDHPDCGLLTPAAFWPDGSRQYLCKRYPAILDLFLRGFAPRFLRALFRRRLDLYEMRDRIGDRIVWDPPIVSGCFMLFRGEVFERLNGFDPRYMLYFEDFDISLRASEIARIAYVPEVRIIHDGGNAARKGAWHIRQFLRSAVTFYSSHGVRLF